MNIVEYTKRFSEELAAATSPPPTSSAINPNPLSTNSQIAQKTNELHDLDLKMAERTRVGDFMRNLNPVSLVTRVRNWNSHGQFGGDLLQGKRDRIARELEALKYKSSISTQPEQT